MENEEIKIPNFENNNQPQQPQPQPPQNVTKVRTPGKAPMIATIILFALAVVFTAYTLFFLLRFINSQDKTGAAIGFVLFFFYGWIVYIPAIATSIAGVVTAGFGMKSNSKSIKITSIIFLILNILMVIAVLAIAGILIIFPSSLATA